MFLKYYEFIQEQLKSINQLNKDATFANYFKAVISGIIVMMSYLIGILALMGVLTMPYLAYVKLFKNPLNLETYESNKKKIIRKGLILSIPLLIIYLASIIPLFLILMDYIGINAISLRVIILLVSIIIAIVGIISVRKNDTYDLPDS